ncbi:MAG: Type I restriction-modification system, specificity subunit S [Candidatus Jettenia ecosi]|uniref:Type I restriction-modification system, specificity subunit S n=1 Tax=Candidatus Jettenia ecosi TaxID=2494326 RepID=A0A533Q5Y4_9BACT|nr:MAG: Type I restriction-modification system, specificity subunit S [Candidatus Jettenia ecosi]
MAIHNLLNNNDYCFYWLRTLFVSLQDLKNGLIPGIGRDDILLKKFPLPPISEQQAIVERVDKLMTMIDELEIQVSEHKGQAEMLMQSVLREAFTK